jgi:hypothetical protein
VANVVPTSQKQRDILTGELERETAAMNDPATKAEDRQLHARNIIAIRRSLANKATDFPPSEDENPDYVAQVRAADASGDPLGFTKGMGAPTHDDPLGFTKLAPVMQGQPLTLDLPAEKPVLQPNPNRVVETPGGAGIVLPSKVASGGRETALNDAGMGRMALETGGAALGGTAGFVAGGPFGERVGEGVGAGVGSILSNVFDPQKEPVKEAILTGMTMTATGALASGLGGTMRGLTGKPTDVGLKVAAMMEKRGEIPPASAVFDSGFIRDMQSIGSAAFAVGHRVEQVNQRAISAASTDLAEYANSFSRYYTGAKQAFAKAEALLPGADKRIIPISRDVIEATEGLISTWEREGMMAKASPLVHELQAVLANPNIRGVKLSIQDAQELESMLFTRAREMERSAKMGNVDAGGTSLISKRYDMAYDVRAAIDGTVDGLIANRQIPTIAKPLLAEGRAMWKMWKQGELVETMVAQATKDIEGDALVKGERLLSEIDKIAKKQEGLTFTGAGRKQDLLSDEVLNNMRRYAQVLKAVEQSGREGGFQLAARRGQLVGITKMAAVGGGTGAAVGGAAGVPVGAAVGAAMGVLTPPALAYIFSNRQAMGLLLRGMKLEPGSALAVRTARELSTLLVKNGVAPAESADTTE